jgi:IclR family acetate operon transcriptional repressor
MSSASDESAHAKGAGASRLLLRGLSILTCLADHPEGLTLQQISKEVDIPVGTAHRVLTSLQMSGFVDRSDTTRRFALGAEARRLGTSVDEARAAPDALTAAAVETGETSFLTKLRGRSVVCVSLVESRHHLRLFVKVGQELPLHAAASARTILAYSDPLFVEDLLSTANLAFYTIGTIRELNRLIDHLADIRQRGFDVCESELDENVWAVSAPVFGFDDTVQWALTIAAAEARVRTAESRAEMTAAATLSREFGFEGEPPAVPDLDFLLSFHGAALASAHRP